MTTHADISSDVEMVKTACGKIHVEMRVAEVKQATARARGEILEFVTVYGDDDETLEWAMHDVDCQECRLAIASHPEMIRE